MQNTTDSIAQDDTPITRDRAAINRLNAQGSTGPRTEEGKRRSSVNAVKTALTGRTVLLPTDDVAYYEQHVARWFADRKPQTPREEFLTQSIADTEWRLERIVQIESSLFALGRLRFAAALYNENYQDVDDESIIPKMQDGETYLYYEKQLRNLGVQEARLRRQREKDLKELKELQTERRAQEEAAATSTTPSQANTPSPAGFVFANGSVAPSPQPIGASKGTPQANTKLNGHNNRSKKQRKSRRAA